MRVARDFMRKVPTEIEYNRFVLMQKHLLPEDWTCPVCGRDQRELMRWKKTKKGGHWSSRMHLHHDHGDRWKGKTLICSDCNAADGLAKRLLKLPKNWSFSDEELKEFVTCEKNGSIEHLDLDIAFEIFLNWINYHDL